MLTTEILPDCRRARRGGRCRRQTIGSLSGQQQQQPVATFAPTPPLSMPIPPMLIGRPRPIPMPPSASRFCQLLSNTRSNTRSNPHLA
uniref:Uncharacterized protein n=1 Tax=Macrostomum lignano TaxID=282301 RepID=A0A1I8FJQ0_9PLAT